MTSDQATARVADHSAVGTSVMAFTFDDADFEEVFTYTAYEVGGTTAHAYFDGDGANRECLFILKKFL